MSTELACRIVESLHGASPESFSGGKWSRCHFDKERQLSWSSLVFIILFSMRGHGANVKILICSANQDSSN